MQLNKIAIAFMVIVSLLFAASTANAGVVTVGTPVVNSSNSSYSVSGVMEVKAQYDYVGTYIAVPKSKLAKKRGKLVCFWTKPGEQWTNSMYVDGVDFKYYSETTRAKLCKLKKPVRKNGKLFTHAKVAGGKTGKPCYNWAIPPSRPQPKPQITGNIMDYSTLQYVVNGELKGVAQLSAQAECRTASGSASATAVGNGSYSITVSVVVKAKSRAQAAAAGASGISLKVKQDVEIKAQGNARLDLTANANVRCNDIAPPTCPDGTPIPPEGCGTTPPPPPASSARCTGLLVSDDLTLARGISATVTYETVNATLTGVTFYWGDNTTTNNGTSTTAKHQYSAYGTYSVYAVLTFRNADGSTRSSTCAAVSVTKKDGSTGPGSGTPGQPGGPGAGGTPEPDNNTGKTCILPDGSVGYKDQFGNCNEYAV